MINSRIWQSSLLILLEECGFPALNNFTKFNNVPGKIIIQFLCVHRTSYSITELILQNPITYIVGNKDESMKILKHVGQYISLRNIVDLVSYLLNTISN